MMYNDEEEKKKKEQGLFPTKPTVDFETVSEEEEPQKTDEPQKGVRVVDEAETVTKKQKTVKVVDETSSPTKVDNRIWTKPAVQYAVEQQQPAARKPAKQVQYSVNPKDVYKALTEKMYSTKDSKEFAKIAEERQVVLNTLTRTFGTVPGEGESVFKALVAEGKTPTINGKTYTDIDSYKKAYTREVYGMFNINYKDADPNDPTSTEGPESLIPVEGFLGAGDSRFFKQQNMDATVTNTVVMDVTDMANLHGAEWRKANAKKALSFYAKPNGDKFSEDVVNYVAEAADRYRQAAVNLATGESEDTLADAIANGDAIKAPNGRYYATYTQVNLYTMAMVASVMEAAGRKLSTDELITKTAEINEFVKSQNPELMSEIEALKAEQAKGEETALSDAYNRTWRNILSSIEDFGIATTATMSEKDANTFAKILGVDPTVLRTPGKDNIEEQIVARNVKGEPIQFEPAPKPTAAGLYLQNLQAIRRSMLNDEVQGLRLQTIRNTKGVITSLVTNGLPGILAAKVAGTDPQTFQKNFETYLTNNWIDEKKQGLTAGIVLDNATQLGLAMVPYVGTGYLLTSVYGQAAKMDTKNSSILLGSVVGGMVVTRGLGGRLGRALLSDAIKVPETWSKNAVLSKFVSTGNVIGPFTRVAGQQTANLAGAAGVTYVNWDMFRNPDGSIRYGELAMNFVNDFVSIGREAVIPGIGSIARSFKGTSLPEVVMNHALVSRSGDKLIYNVFARNEDTGMYRMVSITEEQFKSLAETFDGEGKNFYLSQVDEDSLMSIRAQTEPNFAEKVNYVLIGEKNKFSQDLIKYGSNFKVDPKGKFVFGEAPSAVQKGRVKVDKAEVASRSNHLLEMLWNGDGDNPLNTEGLIVDATFMATFESLRSQGMVTLDANRIFLTPKGKEYISKLKQAQQEVALGIREDAEAYKKAEQDLTEEFGPFSFYLTDDKPLSINGDELLKLVEGKLTPEERKRAGILTQGDLSGMGDTEKKAIAAAIATGKLVIDENGNIMRGNYTSVYDGVEISFGAGFDGYVTKKLFEYNEWKNTNAKTASKKAEDIKAELSAMGVADIDVLAQSTSNKIKSGIEKERKALPEGQELAAYNTELVTPSTNYRETVKPKTETSTRVEEAAVNTPVKETPTDVVLATATRNTPAKDKVAVNLSKDETIPDGNVVLREGTNESEWIYTKETKSYEHGGVKYTKPELLEKLRNPDDPLKFVKDKTIDTRDSAAIYRENMEQVKAQGGETLSGVEGYDNYALVPGQKEPVKTPATKALEQEIGPLTDVAVFDYSEAKKPKLNLTDKNVTTEMILGSIMSKDHLNNLMDKVAFEAEKGLSPQAAKTVSDFVSALREDFLSPSPQKSIEMFPKVMDLAGMSNMNSAFKKMLEVIGQADRLKMGRMSGLLDRLGLSTSKAPTYREVMDWGSGAKPVRVGNKTKIKTSDKEWQPGYEPHRIRSKGDQTRFYSNESGIAAISKAVHDGETGNNNPYDYGTAGETFTAERVKGLTTENLTEGEASFVKEWQKEVLDTGKAAVDVVKINPKRGLLEVRIASNHERVHKAIINYANEKMPSVKKIGIRIFDDPQVLFDVFNSPEGQAMLMFAAKSGELTDSAGYLLNLDSLSKLSPEQLELAHTLMGQVAHEVLAYGTAVRALPSLGISRRSSEETHATVPEAIYAKTYTKILEAINNHYGDKLVKEVTALQDPFLRKILNEKYTDSIAKLAVDRIAKLLEGPSASKDERPQGSREISIGKAEQLRAASDYINDAAREVRNMILGGSLATAIALGNFGPAPHANSVKGRLEAVDRILEVGDKLVLTTDQYNFNVMQVLGDRKDNYFYLDSMTKIPDTDTWSSTSPVMVESNSVKGLFYVNPAMRRLIREMDGSSVEWMAVNYDNDGINFNGQTIKWAIMVDGPAESVHLKVQARGFHELGHSLDDIVPISEMDRNIIIGGPEGQRIRDFLATKRYPKHRTLTEVIARMSGYSGIPDEIASPQIPKNLVEDFRVVYDKWLEKVRDKYGDSIADEISKMSLAAKDLSKKVAEAELISRQLKETAVTREAYSEALKMMSQRLPQDVTPADLEILYKLKSLNGSLFYASSQKERETDAKYFHSPEINRLAVYMGDYLNFEMAKVRQAVSMLEASASIYRQMAEIKPVRDAQGELLAPNGVVSNLPENLWRKFRTKTFKDWFGDWENDPENASKALDENGEPAIVFHGTSAVFYTLEPSRGWAFASRSIDWARGFAWKNSPTGDTSGRLGKILPLVVNARGVIDFVGQGHIVPPDNNYTRNRLSSSHEEVLDSLGLSPSDRAKIETALSTERTLSLGLYRDKNTWMKEVMENYTAIRLKTFMDLLDSMGVDTSFHLEEGGPSVAVRRSEQIKSIANITFGPNPELMRMASLVNSKNPFRVVDDGDIVGKEVPPGYDAVSFLDRSTVSRLDAPIAEFLKNLPSNPEEALLEIKEKLGSFYSSALGTDDFTEINGKLILTDRAFKFLVPSSQEVHIPVYEGTLAPFYPILDMYTAPWRAAPLSFDKEGRILAPNGEISNIQNPGLAKFIRSDEFKEWHGDSNKLVDINGEPRILYHFADGTLISKVELSKTEFGLHLGGDEIAVFFSDVSGGPKTHGYQMFARMDNPLYIGKDLMHWSASSIFDHILDEYAYGNHDFKHFFDDPDSPLYGKQDVISVENALDITREDYDSHYEYTKELDRAMRLALIELGYDGIIYKNEVEGVRMTEEARLDILDDAEDLNIFGKPVYGMTRDQLDARLPKAGEVFNVNEWPFELGEKHKHKLETPDSYIVIDPGKVKSIYNRRPTLENSDLLRMSSYKTEDDWTGSGKKNVYARRFTPSGNPLDFTNVSGAEKMQRVRDGALPTFNFFTRLPDGTWEIEPDFANTKLPGYDMEGEFNLIDISSDVEAWNFYKDHKFPEFQKWAEERGYEGFFSGSTMNGEWIRRRIALFNNESNKKKIMAKAVASGDTYENLKETAIALKYGENSLERLAIRTYHGGAVFDKFEDRDSGHNLDGYGVPYSSLDIDTALDYTRLSVQVRGHGALYTIDIPDSTWVDIRSKWEDQPQEVKSILVKVFDKLDSGEYTNRKSLADNLGKMREHLVNNNGNFAPISSFVERELAKELNKYGLAGLRAENTYVSWNEEQAIIQKRQLHVEGKDGDIVEYLPEELKMRSFDNLHYTDPSNHTRDTVSRLLEYGNFSIVSSKNLDALREDLDSQGIKYLEADHPNASFLMAYYPTATTSRMVDFIASKNGETSVIHGVDGDYTLQYVGGAKAGQYIRSNDSGPTTFSVKTKNGSVPFGANFEPNNVSPAFPKWSLGELKTRFDLNKKLRNSTLVTPAELEALVKGDLTLTDGKDILSVSEVYDNAGQYVGQVKTGIDGRDYVKSGNKKVYFDKNGMATDGSRLFYRGRYIRDVVGVTSLVQHLIQKLNPQIKGEMTDTKRATIWQNHTYDLVQKWFDGDGGRGDSWYEEQVKLYADKVGKSIVDVKSDLGKLTLYLTTAITSTGTAVKDNADKAIKLLAPIIKYFRDGELVLPEFQYDSDGQLAPKQFNLAGVSLRKLEMLSRGYTLVRDKGTPGAVSYESVMGKKHPGGYNQMYVKDPVLEGLIKNYGPLTGTLEYILSPSDRSFNKATDIFGEKVGAFLSSMTGLVHNPTIDRWLNRYFKALTGEAIKVKRDKGKVVEVVDMSNNYKHGQLMSGAIQKAVQEWNKNNERQIDSSTVQAIIWSEVKSLYNNLTRISYSEEGFGDAIRNFDIGAVESNKSFLAENDRIPSDGYINSALSRGPEGNDFFIGLAGDKLAMRKLTDYSTKADLDVDSLVKASLDPDEWVRVAQSTVRGGILTDTERTTITRLAKANEWDRLVDYIGSLNEMPLSELFVNLVKAGPLAGVSVAIRNLGSNALSALAQELARMPASLIDAAMAVGRDRTMEAPSPFVIGRSTLYSLARALSFSPESPEKQSGLRQAFQTLMNGDSVVGFEHPYFYRERKVPGAIGKLLRPLEWYTKGVFRFQSAMDKPFRVFSYTRELNSIARLIKKREGLATMDEAYGYLTLADYDKAMVKSLYNVFQSDNRIASAIYKAMDHGELIRTISSLKVPYVKTPTNIFLQLIDYAFPLGTILTNPIRKEPLLSPDNDVTLTKVSDIMNKEIRAKIFDDPTFRNQISWALGRNLVGWGLGLIGYTLAQNGVLAAAYDDKDRKEYEQDKLKGGSYGTITLDGVAYQISSFNPIAYLFLSGAAVWEEESKAKAKSPEDNGRAAGFMRILSNLAQAFPLYNPVVEPLAQIGEEKRLDLVKEIAPGRIIPSFLAETAEYRDSSERVKNFKADWKTRVAEELKYRIPGLRETLQPKVDMLGRPIAPANNLIQGFDPFKSRKLVTNDELLNVIDEFNLNFNSSQLREGQDFTSKWDEVKNKGQFLEPILRQAISNPVFKQLDKQYQEKVLKSVINFGQSEYKAGKRTPEEEAHQIETIVGREAFLNSLKNSPEKFRGMTVEITDRELVARANKAELSDDKLKFDAILDDLYKKSLELPDTRSRKKADATLYDNYYLRDFLFDQFRYNYLPNDRVSLTEARENYSNFLNNPVQELTVRYITKMESEERQPRLKALREKLIAEGKTKKERDKIIRKEGGKRAAETRRNPRKKIIIK